MPPTPENARNSALNHARMRAERLRNGPRPGLVEMLIKQVYDTDKGGFQPLNVVGGALGFGAAMMMTNGGASFGWLGIAGLALGTAMGVALGKKAQHMLDNHGNAQRPAFPAQPTTPAQDLIPEQQPAITPDMVPGQLPTYPTQPVPGAQFRPPPPTPPSPMTSPHPARSGDAPARP